MKNLVEKHRKYGTFALKTGVLWMTFSVDNVYKSVNNL